MISSNYSCSSVRSHWKETGFICRDRLCIYLWLGLEGVRKWDPWVFPNIYSGTITNHEARVLRKVFLL